MILRWLRKCVRVGDAQRPQAVIENRRYLEQFRIGFRHLVERLRPRDPLHLRGGVGIGARDKIIVVQRACEFFNIPPWIAILVEPPKILGVLLEQIPDELEFFRLSRVHPLMNGVNHLCGLLYRRDDRADRRVLDALPGWHVRQSSQAGT